MRGPAVGQHRRPPAIGRVAGQHHFVARRPAAPAIGAGAIEPLHAEILAQPLDGGLIDHRAEIHGELGEELRIGRVEFVDQGMRSLRAHFLHIAGAPRHRRDDARRGAADPAVDRIGHVGGGEGLAVAEGDVAAEMEGVGPAVRADLPSLGETGADGPHVVIHADQGVGHHGQHLAGAECGGAVRVVPVGVDLAHDGDLVARLLLGQRRQGQGEQNEDVTHALLLKAKPGVERVAQRIPQHVEGQHHHEDGERG